MNNNMRTLYSFFIIFWLCIKFWLLEAFFRFFYAMDLCIYFWPLCAIFRILCDILFFTIFRLFYFIFCYFFIIFKLFCFIFWYFSSIFFNFISIILWNNYKIKAFCFSYILFFRIITIRTIIICYFYLSMSIIYFIPM